MVIEKLNEIKSIIKNCGIAVSLLIVGLIIMLYPMFFISFDLMPGDLGDCRFINYILEHGYLFLKQVPIHSSFWDLPMFYPTKNALSYSDFMLGGMFIYVPLRFLVKSPQTTLQIWLVLVCILNYFSMYLLLKILKFKDISAATGAFLFAFCLPRNIQICHLQLFTQFYSIFSLCAFCLLKRENSKIKNNILFLAGSVLLVIQLYTSYYLGWFMVFGLVVASCIFLCFKQTRSKFIDFIKFYKKELFIYSCLTLILMIPFAVHYLSVDVRPVWDECGRVKLSSFLTSDSFIDKFIFPNKFSYELETMIGVGYLTTILTIAGIAANKACRKYIILFLITGFVLFGEKHLYHLISEIFPGAIAIRAAGRIFFLMLPLYSLSIAFLCDKFKNKTILLLLTLLIITEQVPNVNYWEWTKTEHKQRIAEYKIPDKCKAAAYIIKVEPQWKVNNDIIWAGTENNVYTVNGYSGYYPAYRYDIVPEECTFTIDKEPKIKNNILNVHHRETIYE